MPASRSESHHRVDGPECRITRLPVGYAEDVLWLTFIVATTRPDDDFESVRSRITVRALGDRAPHFLGGGGSMDDHLFTLEMQFGRPRDGRGATYDELSISYLTGGEPIQEQVDLRALGA
ncbi:hypothetical protein GCM10012276_05240 [Nocardioides deserti]|nr:hypothetical protein GCM10012276_05240 [Nocardioides deserti]